MRFKQTKHKYVKAKSIRKCCFVIVHYRSSVILHCLIKNPEKKEGIKKAFKFNIKIILIKSLDCPMQNLKETNTQNHQFCTNCTDLN